MLALALYTVIISNWCVYTVEYSHGMVYSPMSKAHNTALAQRDKPFSLKLRHTVAALWHSQLLLNQHLTESLE